MDMDRQKQATKTFAIDPNSGTSNLTVKSVIDYAEVKFYYYYAPCECRLKRKPVSEEVSEYVI